jgi:hypothetical protein
MRDLPEVEPGRVLDAEIIGGGRVKVACNRRRAPGSGALALGTDGALALGASAAHLGAGHTVGLGLAAEELGVEGGLAWIAGDPRRLGRVDWLGALRLWHETYLEASS